MLRPVVAKRKRLTRITTPYCEHGRACTGRGNSKERAVIRPCCTGPRFEWIGRASKAWRSSESSMIRDFKIGQSNELVKNGKVFDLHNCFNFAGLILQANRKLILVFSPDDKHGNGLRPVSLEFRSIAYLAFSRNFGADQMHDLDELGYKAPADQDDRWLLSETQAGPDDHFFFRFSGGHHVRVFSEQALLFEGQNVPLE